MAMKKFINKAENLVPELIDGYVRANPEIVKQSGERIVSRVVPKEAGKVGVVTMGGAGHEPALIGWVGKGLMDVVALGDIFAAPGAPREGRVQLCAGSAGRRGGSERREAARPQPAPPAGTRVGGFSRRREQRGGRGACRRLAELDGKGCNRRRAHGIRQKPPHERLAAEIRRRQSRGLRPDGGGGG